MNLLAAGPDPRSRAVGRLVRTALALLLCAAGGLVHSHGAYAGTTASPSLSVVGSRLVDGAGRSVNLAGVNRSGTEYACAQGWGLFDGPTDDASIDAMTRWHVDSVRVPLNESCWLSVGGVKPQLSGTVYRTAVRQWVDRLQRHGLLVVLDLHLTAPGSQLALQQQPMPDADHSVAFWQSVATEYQSVPGLAFELFNEPRDVSWDCWQNGCRLPAGWQSVGMQALIDAVRATGARQPVIVEGLGWGNDLSGWESHPLQDPAGQLVAGFHVYEHSQCRDAACWDRTVAAVAQRVPVVTTEVGETDCGHAFSDGFLSWADAHHVGYLGWTWDVWPGCGGPTLITDYTGTPSSFGVGYRDHLAARAPTAGTAGTGLPRQLWRHGAHPVATR